MSMGMKSLFRTRESSHYRVRLVYFAFFLGFEIVICMPCELYRGQSLPPRPILMVE